MALDRGSLLLRKQLAGNELFIFTGTLNVKARLEHLWRNKFFQVTRIITRFFTG